MVAMVISGGQTGVDRAALDAALELGVPCGGWCPKGRRAEDGRIPDRYPLLEAPTADYPARTAANVRDSDATLILSVGPPTGGTLLTLNLCVKNGKPYLLVDLRTADAGAAAKAAGWLRSHESVNVAGPRESKSPGVYAAARAFLARVLRPLEPTDGE